MRNRANSKMFDVAKIEGSQNIIKAAFCPQCRKPIYKFYGSVGVCACGQATLFKVLIKSTDCHCEVCLNRKYGYDTVK